MSISAESSIHSRFIYTLIANLCKALFGFLTGLVLARGLGPEEYGVFSFLLASFTALMQLLDMGSSNAFYTFVSKQNRSKRFINSYVGWLILQFFLSVLFIYVIAPEAWISSIWHGEERERVLIAFVAVFFQRQLWNFISQLGESQRFTKQIQLFNVLVSLTHLVLVSALFIVEKLAIELVFILMTAEFAFAIALAWWLIPVEKIDEKESYSSMIVEYRDFCLPLIPYAWFGMAMAFLDTWLLQEYGGAVQQAYYSVGAQFANISLIATVSILRILWKEVAEAWHKGEQERVKQLFDKTSRILFFLGALVSGYLIPWTSEIISLTLGSEYLSGALAMAVMFLYPVHQTLGQVVGSMYFAMEKSKTYVILGSIHILLSIICVYFVLAPKSNFIPGMELGATGLALKMVIVQVLTVNLSIFWLSRMLCWEYRWLYQPVVILVLLGIGALTKQLVSFALPETWPILVPLVCGLLGYLLFTLLALLVWPRIIGLEKGSLIAQVKAIRLRQ